MRRLDPDAWAAIAMLAVLLLAAGPTLFGAVPTSIPHALWIVLFAALLAALLATFWWSDRPRLCAAAFGGAVLASWVLVLGARGVGLVPILLVVTVSIAPYLLPLWVGVALIPLNLLVLVAALWSQAGRGAEGWALELTVMVGFYLLIQAATLFSSTALLREQRSRQQLAAAHVELQAASALLADAARGAERLRISRELHDLIGHQLTVLALELEAAKHRGPEHSGEHVARAERVARTLLRDVRETVGELRAESADLHETLRRVVERVEQPTVSLHVDEGVSLDEPRTVLFVRAVQEVVTNAIRHARASELWIEIRETRSGFVLTARDDGVGAREVVPGNGLLGLRERFEAVGGSVSFDGSRGFGVSARVPRAGSAAAAGFGSARESRPGGAETAAAGTPAAKAPAAEVAGS